MWSPPAILLLWAGAVIASHLPSAAWAVLAPAGGGAWTFPTKLELERALPRRGMTVEELAARDRARHARGRNLLGSSSLASDGLIDLPVEGTFNPRTSGLYYTRVKLGNPWKEFVLQIDTGSDIMWVTCSPCNGCLASSELINVYEPDKSTTASQITCGDDKCTSALQSGYASCSTSGSSRAPCNFTLSYGDGGDTSGYYVTDELYFNSILEDGRIVNSSAPIVFGCSNSQPGDLFESHMTINGIFGFGQHELSAISQLSAAGVAPKVFSHCLNGSDTGGGILVLGGIVDPGIVYTPIVKSLAHYHVNLESIAVNGQTLSIDPSVFTTKTHGTIIDSGTTLGYLAEQAYDPFINAITTNLSSSVSSIDDGNGRPCFLTSGSIDESFPMVTLKFMGGASMILKPEDYLLLEESAESSAIWCLGWQKSPKFGATILGDIVLKDKIFIYDLANQKIGWTNHDCKQCSCFQSANVTTGSGRSVHLNASQLHVSGSPVSASGKQLPTIVLAIVYIATVIRLWR